jgi:hypothetical protein
MRWQTLMFVCALAVTGCGGGSSSQFVESDPPAAQAAATKTRPVAPASSAQLSRSEAARMLEDSRHVKSTVKAFEFLVGRHASALNLSESRQQMYRALTRVGYVDTSGYDDTFHALPKASGEDFSCDERHCRVTVARAGNVEVAGLSTGERDIRAKFTWGWALTPVGTELQNAGLDFGMRISSLVVLVDLDMSRRYEGSAHLRLYDDGWRVQSATVVPR